MSWNNSWKFPDINVTLGTMMGMGKLNKKKKKKQNQNSSRIPKVIFEKLGKKKKKEGKINTPKKQ